MRKTIAPVLAVLAVGAGLVGMQLGQGAISSIDPLYFSGAPLKAEDVVRDAALRRGPTYADGYSWERGYQARAADCGSDCPPISPPQERMSAPSAPGFADTVSSPAARADEQFDEAYEDAFDVASAPAGSQFDRYLHYPVSHDQAERARAAPTEAAEAPSVTTAPTHEPVGL